MEAQPLTDWNTDLFECFEDASTCKNKNDNFDKVFIVLFSCLQDLY